MDSLLNSRPTAALTQLGYVGIGVSDLETWKRFATEILGMQINGEGADGSIFLRMDDYHHRYQLFPNGDDDILFHGWEVKDAAALEQIAAQIRAYGLDVTEATPEELEARMVLGMIKFNDPDGLPTEIYYGARVDHTPFRSPRGLTKFTAGHMGLGHIALIVKDSEAYSKFFIQTLGAKLSDRIIYSTGAKPRISIFHHVNPRHHSLALNQRTPEHPPRRLGHLMMEVPTMDDVGRARMLFEQHGFTATNLGRHSNDKMLSFYGETPSGFFLEYGYDGMQILDEEKWEVIHHTSASLWGHGPTQPLPVEARIKREKTPA